MTGTRKKVVVLLGKLYLIVLMVFHTLFTSYNFIYSEGKLIKIESPELSEVKTFYYTGAMLTEIKKTVTSSSPVLETYKLNYYPDNNLSTLAIGLDTSSGVSTTIIYQYFYSQLNQLVQLKDGDNRILANYVYKDNNISVINSQNTEQKHNYHTFSNPFKKRKFLDGWYALPENAALWFSENALKSREIWVNGDLHETHNYSYKFDNNKLMEFADSSFIWNTVTVKKFNYSYNCQ